MKKNSLLPDDIWTFPSDDDPGIGRAALPPGGAGDTLFVDEGEPYALAADTGGTTGLVVGAAKPVATIAQLADYLVNGFWQYNGTIAHHFASSTITYNISALNAAEQFLAVSAMQAWHDVANINFVQTSGAANITFSNSGSMQAYTSAAWYSSGAIAYANVVISSDWITNDGGAYDGKTGIDSYGYQTYIHEIGHALGLGHQGPYNGSASYSTNAVYANDTWQYSIMSYFPENNYSGSSYRYVVTPQMADIYAVALIYGAATSTRTGDTIYGFNSNAGAVFNFAAYTSAPALTIYDSGGMDTLDCSGYSAAQTIDLRSGAFSSIGGLVNNIGINAVIEKAIGGSGNDALFASDAACTLSGGGGNDTLDGGAGNDSIVGGSGTDVAVFSGAHGNYVIAYNSATQTFTVVDQRSSGQLDGADTLTGVENFQFSDGTFASSLFLNPPTFIEALGSSSLVQISSYYFLQSNSSGSGPELKCYGAPVVVGQFSGWSPIATEQTASGYQVVWKSVSADQYIVWSVDSNGNYLTNTAPASGFTSAMESLELTFLQDLNGDGTIGFPIVSGTVLESFGSTKLVQTGSNYHLASVSGGTGPELKCYGAPVTVGQFSGWSPIGTEQTASGYQVVWKSGSADQYIVWSTDSGGSYLTNTAPASGASATITSLETTLQQDLNGDGTIGAPAPSGTTIESSESTKLLQVGSNYYLVSISGGSGPELKCYGTPVTAGQFSGWAPIGTEQTASGYQVVWKNLGADQYIVWSVDSSGNYITNAAPVSGSSATIKSLEASFQQDLNGDSVLGAPSLASAKAAASPTLSNDTFLFRADFGAPTAGAELGQSMAISSGAHLIFERSPANHIDLLQSAFHEAFGAGQDAVAHTWSHYAVEPVKLLTADLHAGFLFNG